MDVASGREKCSHSHSHSGESQPSRLCGHSGFQKGRYPRVNLVTKSVTVTAKTQKWWKHLWASDKPEHDTMVPTCMFDTVVQHKGNLKLWARTCLSRNSLVSFSMCPSYRFVVKLIKPILERPKSVSLMCPIDVMRRLQKTTMAINIRKTQMFLLASNFSFE